ncbi:macro domain-containing protein [Acutalibacter caecimuris]|uniref:macro domain-containing protein n=1 Tax=Acutalibacter caecimuris TaxID=3093657 RepID=UPI002AC967FC|nr:macro domain-containing protein [Acutalibacter sp. M00118]
MPFHIVRQDITKMQVDAIVNAANTALQIGGGVCGAIFNAAGAQKMQTVCDKLAPIQPGEAVVIPGFALPAKYVIHAAGPDYHPSDRERCRELLRSAYTESLKLAKKHRCKSIALPLISSGIYGYPKAEALEVAKQAIEAFLDEYEMEAYLAVFDKSAFVLSETLLGEVESYIDQHYVDAHQPKNRNLLGVESAAIGMAAPLMPMPMMAPSAALDDLMERLDEPFSDTLLKLIDAKGKTDVEVYKRANIDRKLFSKIRKGHGYTPRKPTILALAIALELTLPETDDLLERAGYALSQASKFDVIVEYFIVNGRYDIFEINEVLFQYDQPLLGV